MKLRCTFVAAALIACLGTAGAAPARPRLVVFTDIGGDPDDQQSLVRLLLYANEIDIEGLLATSRLEHGDDPRPDLIREIVEAYGRVLPNLRRHAPGYPPAARLLERIAVGRPGAHRDRPLAVGPGQDTDASRRFVAIADRKDPRPLHVAVWGGATDLAQALDDVRRTRPPGQVQSFLGRLRVYAIEDQDGAGAFVKREFPTLRYVEGTGRFDSLFRGMYQNDSRPGQPIVTDEVAALGDEAWVRAHVVEGHGPLGALYPPAVVQNPRTERNRRGVKEGDTPSWFYVLPNGLGDPEEPTFGGWGGRFRHVSGGLFQDAEDAHPSPEADGPVRRKWTVARWRAHYQNDFAARMDWCVAPPRGANHPPVALVAGALRRRVRPGARVVLDARGSRDPDGDPLRFRWWFYDEPSGWDGPVAIEGADEARAVVVAPPATEPRTVHLVLEVTDAGSPPLTRYRRVILTVAP